jgi:hypothetical protein
MQNFEWKPDEKRRLRRTMPKHNIKMDMKQTGSVGCIRIVQVSDSYEHGNQPWDSIKGMEYVELLRDYRLLKKDSGPWS